MEELHPHAIVLWEKDMPEAEYLSLARDVIALCKKYDVQCMLHSFINVAMELEHPYIHLPLPILEAYVKKNVSGNISTGMSKSTDNYQQFSSTFQRFPPKWYLPEQDVLLLPFLQSLR